MESPSILKNLPDLDKIVAGMAEDMEKITVLLYDLQKSLDRSHSPPFANVRKELRGQWEGLRTCIQSCYSFGEDVLMLGDALGKEATAGLIEFLYDMKASADVLRGISQGLKEKDMSEAFSKGSSASAPNLSSIKGIQNANLKAFVVAIGSPSERKYIGQIDNALGRFTLNFETMSEFWEGAYEGCDSLIEIFKTGRASIAPADAAQIVSNWKRYQEATTKAILSITKTNNAILVEAVGAQTTGTGDRAVWNVCSLLWWVLGFLVVAKSIEKTSHLANDL